MALPGPASLAFTPLPTPLSLFTRRTPANDTNTRDRKGAGKATRPSTSPGIASFGVRPSSPPASSNGEVGGGRGLRARRTSLFHRPFSVVFADEDEKQPPTNQGVCVSGTESGTTSGTVTPMPTPRNAGLRRGRAMSIASYSTPSTPSSTTPTTPSTSPLGIQSSIHTHYSPRPASPYPRLKRPTSSGGESTMSTSSTASRSERLATRIGAFFTRSSPLRSRGGSDASHCGRHAGAYRDKASFESLSNSQVHWKPSISLHPQPPSSPYVNCCDIRLDSEEFRSGNAVNIEDASLHNGGGGGVEREAISPSHIAISASDSSSKFREEIDLGEGDDGGMRKSGDGAGDGSRGGSNCGGFSHGARLDLADVDDDVQPIVPSLAHPPSPSLPPLSPTGDLPPALGSSYRVLGALAASLNQAHNPSEEREDGEDTPPSITSRKAEASDTQHISPTQAAPVYLSRHIAVEPDPEAPLSSYPSQVKDSSSTDANLPSQLHSPRPPTHLESEFDTIGDSVGVQPCCRRTSRDRIESWANDGITKGTNTGTSCRDSHLGKEGLSHPSRSVECRPVSIDCKPPPDREPRYPPIDDIATPRAVPSSSEHEVEAAASPLVGQHPQHSPSQQGLEEPPCPHSPGLDHFERVSEEASPALIDKTDGVQAKMISSSHQSSSVSASGHPQYPYAPHHARHNNPHSHHGHGSQGISYLSQGGSSKGYAYQQLDSGSGVGAGSSAVAESSTGAGRGNGNRVGGRQQPQLPAAQGQGRGEGAAAKANLRAWWNQFNFVRGMKKDAKDGDDYRSPDNVANTQGVVFGKPLKESLKYASVQISTANADGNLYVWGYIPVVVAKCGLYLKERATEVPGTFRVNGSNRRIRELQAAFETPPRYGKNLDWKHETYTTHDVASVFRRYLTQMPEPVIPYDLYHEFRDALAKEPYNQDEVVARYKQLIRQMPRSNQYLLLYVLDLLSVFARKSDKNLMTAANLAVIFRPGVISHPEHEMAPQEHALSQKVLEFLIAHQDHFMLEIPPVPQRRGSGQPQQQTTPQNSQGQTMPTHSRPNSTSSIPQLGQQHPPPSPVTGMPAIHERRASSGQVPVPSSNVSSGAVAGVGSSSSSPAAPVAASSNAATTSSLAFAATPAPAHDTHASTRRARPVSEMVADAMAVPSNRPSSPGSVETREEYSGIGGGGWKLVSKVVGAGSANGGKDKEKSKLSRRRSAMERSDVSRGMLEEGDMTADSDRPISYLTTSSGGTSVKRSRTLPSGSKARRQENVSGGSNDSGLGGLGPASPSKEKENALVSFAEASGNAPSKGSAGAAKERRSVLVKKSRRASASVPNMSGGAERT